MDAHTRLVTRVAAEQDEILDTLQMVDTSDTALVDRLFDNLTDLLVEGMFLELREEYLAGAMDRDDYVDALAALADKCRNAGLLPLPSRH